MSAAVCSRGAGSRYRLLGAGARARAAASVSAVIRRRLVLLKGSLLELHWRKKTLDGTGHPVDHRVEPWRLTGTTTVVFKRSTGGVRKSVSALAELGPRYAGDVGAAHW